MDTLPQGLVEGPEDVRSYIVQGNFRQLGQVWIMPKHIRVEKVVQLSRKLYTGRATTFNERNE